MIKAIFSKNSILYTISLIIGITLIIVNRINVGFNSILWIADFGSLFGILQVIFLAKHNYLGYVFNILATIVIGITSLIQHIWLNAFICLLINLPSMIIGLIRWFKNEKIDETKNLKKLTIKNLFLWIVKTILTIGLFTLILYLLNGNLFYLDAPFSALCMIGVVLTSKMYIDSYYFFIPSNIVGIIMFIILSLQTPNNIPYIFTNIVYLIINTLGLINWSKLKREQNNIHNQLTKDKHSN